MIRVVKKFVVLLTTFLIAVVLVAGFRTVMASSHFWAWRWIAVSRDGKPSPEAAAFQSKDGSFLIYISSEDNWYSFDPSDSRMGLCSMDRYIPLYFGLFLRDETAPCVLFNDVKARDPQLDVRAENHFLFTSMRNERVEVWLDEP